jgi:hypothetical protein
MILSELLITYYEHKLDHVRVANYGTNVPLSLFRRKQGRSFIPGSNDHYRKERTSYYINLSILESIKNTTCNIFLENKSKGLKKELVLESFLDLLSGNDNSLIAQHCNTKIRTTLAPKNGDTITHQFQSCEIDGMFQSTYTPFDGRKYHTSSAFNEELSVRSKMLYNNIWNKSVMKKLFKGPYNNLLIQPSFEIITEQISDMFCFDFDVRLLCFLGPKNMMKEYLYVCYVRTLLHKLSN